MKSKGKKMVKKAASKAKKKMPAKMMMGKKK